ncbi:hypothetical protein B296_00010023 [Ensete ventricosum]|uniref:Uncharacterized protein n=1 Tax=Ensete ventricosum TaxID=4639 RepID=A0A426ZSN2_ENSVE|nr:hypothetical protein B296_00010023 [Ensete ventricosum]
MRHERGTRDTWVICPQGVKGQLAAFPCDGVIAHRLREGSEGPTCEPTLVGDSSGLGSSSVNGSRYGVTVLSNEAVWVKS